MSTYEQNLCDLNDVLFVLPEASKYNQRSLLSPNWVASGTSNIYNLYSPGYIASDAVLYVDGGELKVLDAANNTTILSPHPDGSEDWVFYSKNLKTGKTVKIQMQKLMKKLNDLLGEDLFEEWYDDIT